MYHCVQLNSSTLMLLLPTHPPLYFLTRGRTQHMNVVTLYTSAPVLPHARQNATHEYECRYSLHIRPCTSSHDAGRNTRMPLLSTHPPLYFLARKQDATHECRYSLHTRLFTSSHEAGRNTWMPLLSIHIRPCTSSHVGREQLNLTLINIAFPFPV